MIRLLVLLAVLISPLTSFANSPINIVGIKGIVIHDFGTEIHIVADVTVTNSESCVQNDRLVVLKSNPSFKEIYSAALAIYLSGGKFSGWVNGCGSVAISAPILTRMDLVK